MNTALPCPALALRSRRPSVVLLILCVVLFGFDAGEGRSLGASGSGPVLDRVTGVEWQPLAAQVRRLIEALDALGQPLPEADRGELGRILAVTDRGDEALVDQVQAILDRHCLFGVNINPEMRVKVAPGPAKPELVEAGWRQFLVKVKNESGTTAELVAVSSNALNVHEGGASGEPNPSHKLLRKRGSSDPLPSQRDLWLDLQMFNAQPMTRTLGGLGLEYRIVQLYSRDAGHREARIGFNVGQGTQDIGFRNEVDVLFRCEPAREVRLAVRDEHGKPTTGMFVIRDAQGRVYPSQAKRLAPDFPFHPQIYRADGESVRLPDGEYLVETGRGPEYRLETRKLEVRGKRTEFATRLVRWIDPSVMGWWSGDHHIHAAGCSHYTKPTEGVHAPDMMRHILGEDLKIGCNLTWGPCFDYQKQFFTGKDDKVSKFPYLLHYDVEVSGFGSHQSGHLCLLRLRDQIYPGGDSDRHWPALGLSTLTWAKRQGAVTGPAHSGWGLQVDTAELPNLVIPPFDGIGANEYIVDVTHEVPGPDGALVPAVDFLSTVDTPYVWELNIWYHTLNAGFRTRISGETDFPCIYGERVGLGRSYVQLRDGPDYTAWCEGIRQGRNYVGDGRSHLIGFHAQAAGGAITRMGENGSELRLAAPGSVRFLVKAAALLNEKADPGLRARRYSEKPYWDVERARIGDRREVPVELVVNGKSVAKQVLVADGHLEDVAFDVVLEKSSWVTVRVLPSSHSNPIFVTVGGKPIRPSRRSVEWCLKSVDQCWSNKERYMKGGEHAQAVAAYDHAREVYRQRLTESEAD